jgi:hypothetical protein
MMCLKYKSRYAQTTMRRGAQTVRCIKCGAGVTEEMMDVEEKSTNMYTLNTMVFAVICL